jgi:hypothetical protein
MSGKKSGTTRIDDPSSLERAGHNALELAGNLNSDAKLADDDTTFAASCLKGTYWYGSLGNAMDQVVDTWQAQSEALVRRCRSIHTKCAATADSYAKTETINTQNLSAARSQSPFG